MDIWYTWLLLSDTGCMKTIAFRFAEAGLSAEHMMAALRNAFGRDPVRC